MTIYRQLVAHCHVPGSSLTGKTFICASVLWQGDCSSPGEDTTVLRITTRDIAGDVGLFVEGRLAGPCVGELEKCWRRAVAGESPVPTVIDLTDVSYIDENAKQLLVQMHEHGIKLIANGLLSKLFVEQIERA